MESLQKLEVAIAGWYKDVPHMPENGRKWLATNAWWLALVSTILGAIGIGGTLIWLTIAGVVLVGFGGAVGAAITGVALVAVLIALAFSVVNVVLGMIAIAPLKVRQKRGWTLLFIITLLNVLSAVVTFLFNYNVFQLAWSLLFVAIAGYFLFEVRPYFHEATKVKRAVAASHKREEEAAAEG